MKRVLLILGLALSILLLVASGSSLSPVRADDDPVLVQDTDVRVCTGPTDRSEAACHARVRTDALARSAHPARPGTQAAGATPNVLGNGGAYDPAWLRSAYNLSSLATMAGAGQTVAIVDAFDAATAESDLTTYRSYFGLSACTTANGCFRKVNQSGSVQPLPAPDSGWAQEIALDLDMVSALCPNCHILLVEATSASYSDLGTAVNTAVSLGAAVVSNSYGGSEYNGQPDAYYNHPGVAITVSSGDSGYGVEFPAASRYVTAVGGTTLHQASNSGSRNATETVWTGAGSGCSAYEPKPSWQQDSGCGHRTVADVAADADPSTGVWVYAGGGWYIFGGTSVAAPIVGAVYALTGAPAPAFPSAAPYVTPAALFDITAGSNGACGGGYLCTGTVGYDGPTGLGTPNGVNAFKGGVAAQPDFLLTAGPGTQTVTAGAGTSYTVSETPSGGFTGTVTLSVSGLPTGAVDSFTPNVTTSPATLSVTTSTTTIAGSYPLIVTGTGGGLTHTATVTLIVNAVAAGDFALVVNPASLSCRRYNQSTCRATVNVTARNGYASTVRLSVKGLPSGTTGTFSPSLVGPTASATLTLYTTNTGLRGTYTLTIAGTDSNVPAKTHSTQVTLQILR